MKLKRGQRIEAQPVEDTQRGAHKSATKDGEHGRQRVDNEVWNLQGSNPSIPWESATPITDPVPSHHATAVCGDRRLEWDQSCHTMWHHGWHHVGHDVGLGWCRIQTVQYGKFVPYTVYVQIPHQYLPPVAQFMALGCVQSKVN